MPEDSHWFFFFWGGGFFETWTVVEQIQGRTCCSLLQVFIKSELKVGIIYVKEGQYTEEEILDNNEHSVLFDEFLQLIGDKVRLKGNWSSFFLEQIMISYWCAINSIGSIHPFNHLDRIRFPTFVFINYRSPIVEFAHLLVLIFFIISQRAVSRFSFYFKLLY